MRKKHLLIPILMLSLSSKILGSSEGVTLPSQDDNSASAHSDVITIQLAVQAGQLTKKAAINQLYNLINTLPKGAPGIVEIIDTLGDFGAIKRLKT